MGDKLTVEVFAVGEHVDVIGTSKGKGFAGAVKRHHFKVARRRMVSQTAIVRPARAALVPRRVVSIRMRVGAGHMGNERVTVQASEGRAGGC